VQKSLKVSLLIHNFNRSSALERCLGSVLEQNFHPLELILLDAGSTDGSLLVVERFSNRMSDANIQMRTVNCPPMGVAASRNFAAHLASGDLLCVIDNDACFEDPKCIERLVVLFESSPRLAVVSFRVLRGDTEELDPFSWVFRRKAQVWANRSFRTFTFAGAGCCLRASAFREVGGFWEQLRYSREEEDLSVALIDRKWQIEYSPKIVVRHYFDHRGRASTVDRRRIELRNGILVLWRRFPLPIALLAIFGRILTMSVRTMLRESNSPFELLSSVPEAIRESRSSNLKRQPIRLRSFVKYVLLHLTFQ
jgi:GT2 family glycosyltransferase